MSKFKFIQNKKCEYFPCHKTDDEAGFNCLMCFCPLYYTDDCGGKYTIMKSGIKDCSQCLLPHYNYDYVVEKLEKYNKKLHNKPDDGHSIK